jgi:hypothetical protein
VVVLPSEQSARVFLAERYMPGLDRTTAHRASREFAAQLAAGSSGAKASSISCTFVPTEESVLCVVRAASAEMVADAGRRAGLAFDRIVEAESLSGAT